MIKRTIPAYSASVLFWLTLAAALAAAPAVPRRAVLTVAPQGRADFHSLAAALAAAAPGTVLRLAPGRYRGQFTVRRNGIRIEGGGAKRVFITGDASAGTAGGTARSATLTILGQGFEADGVTIANTFSRHRRLRREGSQAVALLVRGDRAIFRRDRILGYQDTLWAGSGGCIRRSASSPGAPAGALAAVKPASGRCRPAREYFDRCWIAGNVDFIFGGGRAWFERCQIRARAHSIVLVTAQSKHYPDEDSGFVFDRCRLTAAPGARRIFLGRPWRRWAWVVWLRSWLPAPLAPAGWREWRHGGRASLPTAYYAEFDSRGPGADPAGREPYARQLTPRQAARLTEVRFFHGWSPAATPASATAPTEAGR